MATHMTPHRRRAYAMRRVSRAIDRLIVAKTEAERAQAERWIALWHQRSKRLFR